MTTEKREPATTTKESEHSGWCQAARRDCPACARERRRVGDGPAGEVVHYAEDRAPLVTACGLTWSKSARFSWSEGAPDGVTITCAACLAKMGAPAEPAKPTRVEVGQLWRMNNFTMVVTRVSEQAGRAAVRWDDGVEKDYLLESVLMCTYLGMACRRCLAVPVADGAPAAPAEGPAPTKCPYCNGTFLERGMGGYEEPCRQCIPDGKYQQCAAEANGTAPGDYGRCTLPDGHHSDHCYEQQRIIMVQVPAPAPAGLACKLCDHIASLHHDGSGCRGPYSVAHPELICGCKHFAAPAASPVAEPPAAPKTNPAVCTHPSITVDGKCAACGHHGWMPVATEFAQRLAEIDRAASAPAAPVREPGELTFAEAMEALAAEKLVEVSHGGESPRWERMLFGSTWTTAEVARYAKYRYRLKPARALGRARELVAEAAAAYSNQPDSRAFREVVDIVERAVGEVLDRMDAKLLGPSECSRQLRAEFLGPSVHAQDQDR